MTDSAVWMRRAVVLLVGAAVCLYDLWAVRAADNGFKWDLPQGGYYNQLAQAFTSGHLYLNLAPNPELLAKPDPWDPSIDDALKMHDMVLFNRRFYLYHGAAPAVLLFTPWRLLTHRDLPEKFGLFLFCFGAFVCACATLLHLLRTARVTPGPVLLAALLAALGLCQGVPFLLNRVWVYELAIASGYFCVALGTYLLARGLTAGGSVRWLAASGLAFGAAVAGRPHLILCGIAAAAGVALLFRRVRPLTGFLAGFAFAGFWIGLYNYLRFGNPFEFGLRYLLTGAHQNQVGLGIRNWPLGIYYTLLAAPHFSAVFPWTRMVSRYPFDTPGYPIPLHYFLEPTIGALWLAPLLVFALVLWRQRTDAAVGACLLIALSGAVAAWCFLITTHMSSQRYAVDFLPQAVLAAVCAAGIFVSTHRGILRTAAGGILGVLVVYGAVVNLAIGLTGPYDEMRTMRPARYVAIAARFSPVPEYRPRLNPTIALDLDVTFATQREGLREPLIRIGPSQYRLDVEHSAAGRRLISESSGRSLTRDLNGAAGARIMVGCLGGKLAVSVDGVPAFEHDLGTVVAAPAEVTVGENYADTNTTRRFGGTFRIHDKRVE